MTLLDSQGRDTEVLHKARCLGAWIREPRIARMLHVRHKVEPTFLSMMLGAYGGPNPNSIGLEPAIAGVFNLCLSDRIVRRAIAAHLVKTQGIKRSDAMEALKRMGE